MKRLDNFMASWRKPFSEAIMVEYTRESRRKVRQYIARALAEGRLKQVGEIYVQQRRDVRTWTGKWCYSRQAGKAVWEVIRRGKYTSVRGVAAALRMSHQYAFKYMEALASVEMIGWDGVHYVALAGGAIEKIGYTLERGILSRMRAEGGENGSA